MTLPSHGLGGQKTRGFVDHNIGEQPLLQFGNCGN